MHQQIGVATNRRSEVGVRIISQTEVTLVIRAVDRLLHGAQHHRLNDMTVRTLFDNLSEAQVILRLWRLAARQIQAQFT